MKQIGHAPNDITIEWECPNSYDYVYEVAMSTDGINWSTVCPGTENLKEKIYTQHGLTEGTFYWIKVRGIFDGQYGPYSDPAKVMAFSKVEEISL